MDLRYDRDTLQNKVNGRSLLPYNHPLRLQGFTEITIKELIGAGASSLVYRGVYDGERSAIVKEFYPKNGIVTGRMEQGENGAYYIYDKQLYKKAYEEFKRGADEISKLGDITNQILQGDPVEFKDSIYYVTKKFLGNILEDCPINEWSFQKRTKLVDSVLKFLRKLHLERNKIYFDLKPENIFDYYIDDENNAMAGFFDFDSTLDLDMARKRSEEITFSFAWAAPELRVRSEVYNEVSIKSESIGYWSDIFSVGMLLLWLMVKKNMKIMNIVWKMTESKSYDELSEKLLLEDDIDEIIKEPFFSQVKVGDEEYFQEHYQALRRLLTHALQPNPDRRIQSVEQFEQEFKCFKSLVTDDPFLADKIEERFKMAKDLESKKKDYEESAEKNPEARLAKSTSLTGENKSRTDDNDCALQEPKSIEDEESLEVLLDKRYRMLVGNQEKFSKARLDFIDERDMHLDINDPCLNYFLDELIELIESGVQDGVINSWISAYLIPQKK